MGVLLAGMSIWLLVRPPIHWTGPALFALDSFHQLDLSLRLSGRLVPLLWLVWWWMADEPPESATRSPHERGTRGAALSCLLLMLLSDNLWLWYGALASFSLLQQSLIVRDIVPDFRLTALRGSHWLGVLLMLIGIGILTFDFRWQTFSDVHKVFAEWDGFSREQQAELTLAAALAAWSVLLTAAVFPVSVLRIDRDDESGIEILSAAAGGAICVQFAPLFAILDAAAAHRSLLLLTVLTATVCSWRQPAAGRTTRCLGTALIMLSFMGLLIAGVGAPDQLTRALSLEHFALVLVLWSLWDRERLERRSRIAVCSFAVVLLAGFSSGLLTLAARAAADALPGRLIWFIAAGLGFGFATYVSQHFLQTSGDDQPEDAPSHTGTESILSRVRLRTAGFAGFAVVAATRLTLWRAGFAPGVMPAIEVAAAMLLGAVTALLWERHRLRSAETLRTPGTFSRLLESQFHLVSIWQGMIQLPEMMLSTACQLWETWRLRSPATASRRQSPAGSEIPFGWEVGLGLASLFVLSCLFLWTGE